MVTGVALVWSVSAGHMLSLGGAYYMKHRLITATAKNLLGLLIAYFLLVCLGSNKVIYNRGLVETLGA